jgi:hypothetical protein
MRGVREERYELFEYYQGVSIRQERLKGSNSCDRNLIFGSSSFNAFLLVFYSPFFCVSVFYCHFPFFWLFFIDLLLSFFFTFVLSLLFGSYGFHLYPMSTCLWLKDLVVVIVWKFSKSQQANCHDHLVLTGADQYLDMAKLSIDI